MSNKNTLKVMIGIVCFLIVIMHVKRCVVVQNKDSDSDGVRDKYDECTDTDETSLVLVNGCPVKLKKLIKNFKNAILVNESIVFNQDYKLLEGYKVETDDHSDVFDKLPKEIKFRRKGEMRITIKQGNRSDTFLFNVIGGEDGEEESIQKGSESVSSDVNNGVNKDDKIRYDSDGDGILSDYDCDDNDILIGRVGDLCDDLNPKTTKDTINSDCLCQGTSLVQDYYRDQDLDGVGDSSRVRQFAVGENMKGWVVKSGDECPNRAANTKNGCPEIRIKPIKKNIYINYKIKVAIADNGILESDEITWKSDGNLELPISQGQSIYVSSPIVGNHELRYTVEGMDGFKRSETITVPVRVSKKQLRDYLIHLAEYGNNAAINRTEGITKNKSEADEFFRKSIVNDEIVVNEMDDDEISDSKMFKEFRVAFLNTKSTIHSKINPSKIAIVSIKYDEAVTGKIKEFTFIDN